MQNKWGEIPGDNKEVMTNKITFHPYMHDVSHPLSLGYRNRSTNLTEPTKCISH